MWFPLLCVLAILGIFFLFLLLCVSRTKDGELFMLSLRKELMAQITAATSADELMRVVNDLYNFPPPYHLSGEENDLLLQKALGFENKLNKFHWAR